MKGSRTRSALVGIQAGSNTHMMSKTKAVGACCNSFTICP